MKTHKRNTAGLKPFKKGESGNPNGARMHNKEMKVFKNLSKAEMVEVGNIIIKGNLKELKAIKDDVHATVFKVMLAAIAVKIIQQGDMDKLDKLLNRLIGKVKDELELGGNVTHPPRLVIMLPDNGRSKRVEPK